MTEPLLRALVGLGGVAVVAGIVLGARVMQRRDAVRQAFDFTGLDRGVAFFSDTACRRCDRVRAMLESAGEPFTEYRYGEAAEVHARVGIVGVPLVVAVGDGGALLDVAAGVPSRRRLARVLSAGVRGE